MSSLRTARRSLRWRAPSPDALIEELVALRVEPLDQDASIAQIKVAKAQLLGWVNGLILSEANVGTPVVIDTAHDVPVVRDTAR